METQFPEGSLAVQVIVLVQPPVALEDAALRETLRAVLAAPVARRVLALTGTGEDWLPTGFDLMGQRGGDHGERMAAALADAYATVALPMLLIRADVMGIVPEMLEDAARTLLSGEADSALGPASDGGFWLLGLLRPDRSLVVGLPAPGADAVTGAGRLLLERLASAGLRVALAPRLGIAGASALRF
jgi:hypothetical protein